MKFSNLFLSLSLALTPLAIHAAANASTTVFSSSKDFQDKDKPKSVFGTKLGAYDLLQADKSADWSFQDPSFKLGELPSEVPLFVGFISKENDTFTPQEMANAYNTPTLAVIESSLAQRGVRLYRSPEASNLAPELEAQQIASLKAQGAVIKAQMASNPAMADNIKSAAANDPKLEAQLRAMGIVFEDVTPQDAKPFPPSPREASYAIVVLMQNQADDLAKKKPGFFALQKMLFTGALNTNEIYILKDGVVVATVRDTVAFGGLGDTLARNRIGERLIGALK